MIGALIGAIFGGLAIGVLARMVLPGKQDLSMTMTIVIGVISSFIATLLVTLVGYHNKSGFAWVPFIVGVLVACVAIVIYGGLTGKKQLNRG